MVHGYAAHFNFFENEDNILPLSQSIPPQLRSQIHCHGDPWQEPCLQPG